MPADSQVWSRGQTLSKRALDIAVASAILTITWPVIAVACVIAAVDARASGIFKQERIGRDGRPFQVLKIRTMRPHGGGTVTTANDPRITRSGAFMRRWKIDELPQLLNVLRGDMSIVGPRPDVAGFADLLVGRDRRVLSVRPGITGPAALAYRDEERLLGEVDDPERHNREVIWPDKVRINCRYVDEWSLRGDIGYLAQTLRGVLVGSKREDGERTS